LRRLTLLLLKHLWHPTLLLPQLTLLRRLTLLLLMHLKRQRRMRPLHLLRQVDLLHRLNLLNLFL
jgi:hypothetical protein